MTLHEECTVPLLEDCQEYQADLHKALLFWREQIRMNEANGRSVANAAVMEHSCVRVIGLMQRVVETLRIQWIRCDEFMPQPARVVLFWVRGDGIHLGHFDQARSEWFGDKSFDMQQVTHWMPLPTSPAR